MSFHHLDVQIPKHRNAWMLVGKYSDHDKVWTLIRLIEGITSIKYFSDWVSAQMGSFQFHSEANP